MELHTLQDQLPGLRKRQKRLGRGIGSGRGKTSTKGGKGQTARSGGGIRTGFESGHIPLYRKLPHRGFNNKRFATEYSIVNVGDLNRVETSEVDRAEMIASGLIRRNAGLVKILGDGDLEKALVVTADKFSESAAAKIVAAGGKAIVREAKPAAESKEA